VDSGGILKLAARPCHQQLQRGIWNDDLLFSRLRLERKHAAASVKLLGQTRDHTFAQSYSGVFVDKSHIPRSSSIQSEQELNLF
jgi:hypothetical protein